MAGIRLPALTVSLATYTGWNPHHPLPGAPEQALRMHGVTILFAPTPSGHAQTGARRPSIPERYPSLEVYRECLFPPCLPGVQAARAGRLSLGPASPGHSVRLNWHF